MVSLLLALTPQKDLGFHERIIMGGFQKAFVTNNTEVEIEPQPEGSLLRCESGGLDGEGDGWKR